MAYTVVYERENAAPPVRWKRYVARHEGRRSVRLKEGAAETQETAAEEADAAYQQVLQEIKNRRMKRHEG